jgi:hypothetical protein
MRVVQAFVGGLLLLIFTAIVSWPIVGWLGVLVLIFTGLQSVKVIGRIAQFFEGEPPVRRSPDVAFIRRVEGPAGKPKKRKKTRHI